MPEQAKMVMKYDTLTFEWSGGEYVSVFRFDYYTNQREEVDVINVFDYAQGKPEIATLFDFSARVRKYVEENYGLEVGE
jgi:hypothetical protein